MLSKDDYKDYLAQIENIEKDMRDLYRTGAEKAVTERVKGFFSFLTMQEQGHMGLLKDLKDMID